MDTFDAEVFSELKGMYCQKGLSDDDYYILFQRFSNLFNLEEAKPFVYTMRYFGIGTEANPQGVLDELKKMQLKDNIQLKGLACDLLLFQKEDERILSELKRMKEQGYTDIFLGEKSHLHQLISLRMPERGELLYHDRLSCGVRHVCAIDANNNLVSYGWNQYEQCNVKDWDTPKRICCDGISTFGIYSNGDIKITGALNLPEHSKIKEWKDIIDCKGSVTDIYGLGDDGKILISSKNGLYVHLKEALKWNNIIQIISAANGILVGLKKDGKLVTVKIRDPWGATNVTDWENVVQISGSGSTVGLKSDGTVLYAGNGLAGADDITQWKDIVQIAATSDITYGLLETGDVICTPYDNNKDPKNVAHDIGQRMIADWHNIVSIWAGKDYVIGLGSDGKVKFAGDGSNGLDDVNGLQLF